MKKEKKETREPSIINIILNDYASFLSVMFPVVIFGMSIIIEVFGFFPALGSRHSPLLPSDIPFFVILGIISLVIGTIIFYFRYKQITKLFEKGKVVPGIIKELWYYKDRGRIEFTYRIGKLEYTNSISVMKTGKSKFLKVYDMVDIIYLSEDPLKATIMNLFLK